MFVLETKWHDENRATGPDSWWTPVSQVWSSRSLEFAWWMAVSSRSSLPCQGRSVPCNRMPLPLGEGNTSQRPSPHPLLCPVCWWINCITRLPWAQMEPGAMEISCIQLVSWLSVQIWVSLLNRLDFLAHLKGLRRASILTELETFSLY